MKHLFFVVWFILTVTAVKLVLSQELRVRTKYGDVLGSYDKSTGNRVFLGIPYARPPVGDLRFKPPQPPSSWFPKVRNALEFGASCNSKLEDLQSDSFIEKQSEDCLFLNIWTPPKITSPLAVMVWIHGGSFFSGSTTLPEYTGNNLSKQGNVIVVSINYRLGILGFFISETLAKEDPNWPTSGNYGLLDQNMALQWVKENIGAFGGDPENVTIFGQSAGSSSVCFHMLMPKSRGLFRRAILHSGSCSYPLGKDGKRPEDILASQDKGTHLFESAKYMNLLGCSDIACMRNLPEEKIRNFQNSKDDLFTWANVDGVVIPGDPYFMFKNGDFSNVDIIVGTTLNDGSLYSQEISYSEFKKRVENNFPVYYKQILEFYPQSVYKTGFSAYSQLINDFRYFCPSRSLLNLVTANGGKTYQYLFSAIQSYLNPKYKKLEAFHGSELFFLFNYPWSPDYNPRNISFTEEELVLSSQMIDFWSSFAKTGIPTSSRTSVKWENYNLFDQSYINLNVKELKMDRSILNKAVCDLYDKNMISTLGTSFLRR